MTDEKLIDALRRMSPRLDMLDCENVLTAADRIEAQAAEIKRLRGDLAKAVEERDEALNQLDSARHNVDVLDMLWVLCGFVVSYLIFWW